MKIISFLKDWILIIAILAGIAGYFVYVSIPWLDSTHGFAAHAVALVQPLLIFSMLFLTFCRIDPRSLRLRRWHVWLLLIQTLLFSGIALVLVVMPQSNMRVVLEGAMICLICPTATAGAVITRKLGGDVNGITTYTILINLAASVLIPALVPFVHPNASTGILKAALLISSKVFPLLLLPLVGAMALRKFWRKAYDFLGRFQDLSFYLWALALALAIAVTTKSIVHTHIDLATQLWLVAISLLCCAMQFALGRKIGAKYNDATTAGQALGQKNTVLAIWVGYTFFTPVTAIVGGFYSIWHNIVNSYQLYKHKKRA